MIQELLKLAKKTNIKEFTDSQSLLNGTYFMFDKEGNYIEHYRKQLKDKEKGIWEDKFNTAAFFSSSINANKALVYDPGFCRKIQSCSMFSFVTWQSFFENKENLEIAVNAYFREIEILIKDNKLLFPLLEDTKKALKKAVFYVAKNIYEYFLEVDKAGNKNNGNMDQNKILILIKVDDNLYEEAFKCYAKNKLFLDAKYNIDIDGITLGIPSNACTCNSKKPFTMHVSQPNKVNYQTDFENVYYIYLLYKWILNKAVDNNLTTLKILKDKLELGINPSEYYLVEGEIKRTMMGTEFEINNFQFIKDSDDILNIQNENFLELNLGNIQLSKIITWEDFKTFIDRDLFSYHLENKNIKVNDEISSNLINIFNKYRNFYLEAIKYQDISIVKKVLNDSISEILLEQCKIAIKNSNKTGLYIAIIKKLLLMKYNILSSEKINYQGGNEMKLKIVDTKDTVFKKIDGELNPECETIDEYCFAAGQLARYLINQSVAQEITFKEIAPLLNSVKCAEFKYSLDLMEKKYDHALRVHFPRLNNLLYLLHSIEFENRDTVNKDIFLCGFVSENRLYKTNPKKETERASSSTTTLSTEIKEEDNNEENK